MGVQEGGTSGEVAFSLSGRPRALGPVPWIQWSLNCPLKCEEENVQLICLHPYNEVKWLISGIQ